MKKIIISSLLLIMSSPLFSQQIDPSLSMTKQDYVKKSKHQKVAAWSLLGGGLVIGSIGTIIALKEAVKVTVIPFPGVLPPPDQNKLNFGAALMLVSSIAVIGSIPFFIISSKNKRRAASLSLKNGPIPQIYQSSLVYRNIPSLTLKLQL